MKKTWKFLGKSYVIYDDNYGNLYLNGKKCDCKEILEGMNSNSTTSMLSAMIKARNISKKGKDSGFFSKDVIMFFFCIASLLVFFLIIYGIGTYFMNRVPFDKDTEEWYIYHYVKNNKQSRRIDDISFIDSIDNNAEIAEAQKEYEFLSKNYVQDSALIVKLYPDFYEYKNDLQCCISSVDTTTYRIYRVVYDNMDYELFKIDKNKNVSSYYKGEMQKFTLKDLKIGHDVDSFYQIRFLSNQQIEEKIIEKKKRLELAEKEMERVRALDKQRAEENRKAAQHALRTDVEFVRGYNTGYCDGEYDRKNGEPYLSGHDYNGVVKQGQIIHNRESFCAGYDEGYDDGYRRRRQRISF